MYNISSIQPLTKENILELISEIDIFSYYISGFNAINKLFCSELRVGDNSPSCGITYCYNKFLYKDFGNNETYNCFEYVQRLFNCSYIDALKLINVDFSLGLGYSLKTKNNLDIEYKPRILDAIPKSKETIIECKIRDWNTGIDKLFWGSYHITCNTLNKFKIFPLEWVKINNMLIRATNSNPIYGYYFGDNKWKIYQPYNTFNKWFTNTNPNIIQGIKQLPESGDLLVITSSLKDVACLWEFGYNAIAPQSESTIMKPELIIELKSKWKVIKILFDNDNPGLQAAYYSSLRYEIDFCYIPLEYEEKDPSDLTKNRGPEFSKNIIKQILNASKY